MQGISRLVIATAALVGMFVVLLIYAANENNRLDVYAANFEGRSIEGGAALYTEACATCHGANGEGLVGPSLNDAELLVPAPGEVIPSRLIAKGWTGDLESFLTTAIGGGRVGTVMPAWGQVAGGPYNQAQVLDLAAYIMNWGLDPGKKWGGATDRVSVGGVASEPVSVAIEIPNEPPRDVQSATLGRYLFLGPAACVECHIFEGVGSTIGTNLTGVVQARGRDYVYSSITNPATFGHDESVMPEAFGFALSEIDIQSIIDYLEDPEAAGPPLQAVDAVEEAVLPSNVEQGKQLASSRACSSCHSTDGSASVGPTWKGLFGNTRKFTDGGQAIADIEYLTTSIVAPELHIVEGFLNQMPNNYGTTLSPDEIQAIIDYIATLK